MQGLYDKAVNSTKENKDLIKGKQYIAIGQEVSIVSIG